MSFASAGVACSKLIVGDASAHSSVEDVVDSFEHWFFSRCLFIQSSVIGDDSSREPSDVGEFHLLSEVGIHFDASDASRTICHDRGVLRHILQPFLQDIPTIPKIDRIQRFRQLEFPHLRLVIIPTIQHNWQWWQWWQRFLVLLFAFVPLSFLPLPLHFFPHLPSLLQPPMPLQRRHIIPGTLPIQRCLQPIRDDLTPHPNVQIPKGGIDPKLLHGHGNGIDIHPILHVFPQDLRQFSASFRGKGATFEEVG
mmetsp:Transcript_30170/g.62797  ORF Transcript_30170/g.62797 Transcript_30170/m.62797 type:complete len:252 (-) Transcript_30170:1014-1769(-)